MTIVRLNGHDPVLKSIKIGRVLSPDTDDNERAKDVMRAAVR